MQPERVNMLELFDADRLANVSPVESHEEFIGGQHERFKARFRELANAMERHPMADQLAHSIDTLRRIVDGTHVKS